MTDKITIYTTFVSAEDLDLIRANECEYNVHSLSTQRFRALWNEIERLRAREIELMPQSTPPVEEGDKPIGWVSSYSLIDISNGFTGVLYYTRQDDQQIPLYNNSHPGSKSEPIGWIYRSGFENVLRGFTTAIYRYKSMHDQIPLYRWQETKVETRPDNCRHRLQEEGKSYPRSSCRACGKTVASGLGTKCEFDNAN